MKGIARAALRKVGFEVKRISPTIPDYELAYMKAGRIPWSRGYEQAKTRFISEVLANPGLVEVFQKGCKLPEQFGVAFDERCVEYPWLLAHLKPGPERILDAGSTLNHAFILNHHVFWEKKLHILTLAPENNCFWHRGVSYLYDDLRSIPIRDDYYDIIACVSTLEHVGCDNTLYAHKNSHREHRPVDFVLVMQEFRRVLECGGTLFLTVPFGVYRHFGAFQQFDEKLLSRAVEAFGKASEVTETFYRYTREGWQLADAADCAPCEYVEWITRPHDQWPNPLPVERDLAAAARAVACVRLIKG